MRLLSTIARSINQSRNWKNKLEEIVRTNPNGEEFIEFNRKKKSLGISGLGTVLFGELFNLDTDAEVAYVTSAFNLFSSYIDCHLDGTYGFSLGETNQNNVSALLDEAVNYIESQNTDNKLLLKGKPLVEYIKNSIMSRDGQTMNKFCAHVREYAASVNNDFLLENPDTRREERIKLGEAYGSIISDLLDAFSKRKLTDKERKAIQIYVACSTLQDDFVDITEDGDESYILQKNKELVFNLSRLREHRRKIFELYNEGNALIGDSNQKRDYESMFNSLMFAGDLFFVKKGTAYLFQKSQKAMMSKKSLSSSTISVQGDYCS